MELANLDLNKTYSYADYLSWDFPERVELISGKVYKMMAAPSSRHQSLCVKLILELGGYMKRTGCKIYTAPFNVRLPRKSKDDKDIITVVQPDVCVVCDKTKIDEKGCLGAPDVVVEILSPSNNELEINKKFNLYEESGVKEYWIVSPQDNIFLVNILVDGHYITSRPMTSGNIFTSTVLKGFSLDLKELFEAD